MVDLETTGGSASGGSMITEIGAVKVRGGEVLGEFQTLVNPHTQIPPFIAVLTGITNSMVGDAPPIESVLPAFLEFAAGSVLVAHNAPFDVGFLQWFAARQGLAWPSFEVLDTAKIARRVITRDDAPNCKLSSLARAFHASTTPNHRALSDARATVDVLHGLMERLGGLGVHTLEELSTFSAKVSTAQRRKRHLAEGLPHAPGVYLFRDEQARVLYVGTSRDLRTRVRSYFTASETRSRMGEMVGLAESVLGIECATPLEAEVRELRLIAEHKPKYNRRSRFPEKAHYLKLTREPWPRLSLVRQVLDDGADYVGPFSSKRTAEKCLSALHETFPVRQCSQRLARQPSASPCVLAEMGRCLSPCDGSVDETTYAAVVRQLRDNLLQRPDDVVELIARRMAVLADGQRYEEAGRPPRPSRGVRPSGVTHPAPDRGDPHPPPRGRPARGRRAMGRPRRATRPAGGGRGDPGRRRRPPIRHRPGGQQRDGAGRTRARPVRDRRGDRAHPALARGARRPADRGRRRVDLPRRRRQPPPRAPRRDPPVAPRPRALRRPAGAPDPRPPGALRAATSIAP